MTESKTINVIDKKVLKQVAFRSFLVQSSFNYERMQSGGWTYSLIPALKVIHKDKEDLAVALQDHMLFLNTSPQLMTLLLGIVIAMEEAREPRESIQAVKVGIMGPLGGIGDAIFFLTLLPIAAGIGASLALDGNIAGPFIFLLLYNVPYLFVKFYLMRFGYSAGTMAIDKMAQGTKMLSRAGTIVGISVVGALVASTVKLSLAYVIQAGQVSVNVQTDLFDAIMPNMLPLGISLFFFYLIRKNKKPSVIILFTILTCMVLAYFNIV